MQWFLNDRLKVALFVDQSVDDIYETIKVTGCTVAQLHGAEDAAMIRAVQSFVPVWKAFRLRDEHIVAQAQQCDAECGITGWVMTLIVKVVPAVSGIMI